jgi:hypothetical protein
MCPCGKDEQMGGLEKHIFKETVKECMKNADKMFTDFFKGEMKPLHKTSIIAPNGKPVPEHLSRFTVGEKVVIKGYTFKVAYVGETSVLFEPIGPVLIENKIGGIK